MDTPLERAIDAIVMLAEPDGVMLFGSRAGDNYRRESDYDLLVLKRGVGRRRKLAQNIYLNFKNIGSPVDVIVADLGEYERSKNDPYLIYSNAARNGMVVYEKC